MSRSVAEIIDFFFFFNSAVYCSVLQRVAVIEMIYSVLQICCCRVHRVFSFFNVSVSGCIAGGCEFAIL